MRSRKVQPDSQNSASLKGKEKQFPSAKSQRCVGRGLALCQILTKQRHTWMLLQDWKDFRLKVR